MHGNVLHPWAGGPLFECDVVEIGSPRDTFRAVGAQCHEFTAARIVLQRNHVLMPSLVGGDVHSVYQCEGGDVVGVGHHTYFYDWVT